MLSYEKKIFFLNYFQNLLCKGLGIDQSYYRLGYHLNVTLMDDVTETFAFNLKYSKWFNKGTDWVKELEEAKANIDLMIEKLKSYLNEIGITAIRFYPHICDCDGSYSWIEINGYFGLPEEVKEAIVMLNILQEKKNAT